MSKIIKLKSTFFIIAFILIQLDLSGQVLSEYNIFTEFEGTEESLTSYQQKILQHFRDFETTSDIRIVESPSVSELLLSESVQFRDFLGNNYSFYKKIFKGNSAIYSVWYGTSEKGDGDMTLVAYDDRVTGTINVDGQLYRTESLGNDLNVLILTDYSKFIPQDLSDYNKDSSANYSESNSENNEEENLKALSGNSPVIRILMAYTPAFAANHDENGLIATAIVETKQSFVNSGANVSVELAYKRQVNYTETGSFETDLERFIGTTDGYMDEIHNLRDQYYADVCMLILETGNAYGRAGDIFASKSCAFAVVRSDAVTGRYTPSHELGHLIGARHNIEVDNENFPFPYGHGYIDPYSPCDWMTIMGVNDLKYNEFGVRRKQWSRPGYYGNTDTAYVVRVLNEESYRVANFYPVPFFVEITGPTYLPSGESGTFTANPSGGSGTYTNYQWWYRNDEGSVPPKSVKGGVSPMLPPPGVWIYLSYYEGEKTINFGPSFDFSLKCKVTDSDVNTATDIHSVIVGGPAKDIAKKIPINVIESIPEQLTLIGNYPNPFNPTTSIKFGLPDAMPVEISIYSITGKKVRTLINQDLSAGYYQVTWDGTDKSGNKIASGIYIYTLKAGSKRLTSKMLFAK